ncbi:MAG: gluconate:H+ symporter [Clostridia bacterium]
MFDATFIADPQRLIISATLGIILLLALIIKFKLHPVLSLLVSSLFIGLGAGMPIELLSQTVEDGAGKTLQGIVLLIGIGSMFGGILEVSGGAKCVAQTLINKFGESKAGIALGMTGLIVGTAVFFEAGVMILIPLAFSLARRTKKSTLFYAIPMLAGLASGFAFIPPSAGSILVANMLNVDLGIMILVGVPTAILSLLLGGVLWSRYIGTKVYANIPTNILDSDDDAVLPSFKTVLFIILIPLMLILLSTLTSYVEVPSLIESILLFFGTPFVALIVALVVAMNLLGKKQGYTPEQVKSVLDSSLKPTAGILLVITGGGIISEVLQVCGMGDIVGSALEKSGLPLIIVAFLIAGLIRICVGNAIVAMTMATGILISMPEVAMLSQFNLAALVLAINGGSTAFSHVNDSGFWLVNSLLKINEKDTLKSWTVMETIIGFTGLGCALIISIFA